MKTVDIARFIRHIGARDFVSASSMLSGIENFKSKSWSDAEMYCEAHFRRIVLDSETIIYGNEWIGNE